MKELNITLESWEKTKNEWYEEFYEEDLEKGGKKEILKKRGKKIDRENRVAEYFDRKQEIYEKIDILVDENKL